MWLLFKLSPLIYLQLSKVAHTVLSITDSFSPSFLSSCFFFRKFNGSVSIMAYSAEPKYDLPSTPYEDRETDTGEEGRPFLSTSDVSSTNGSKKRRIFQASRIQLGLQIGTFLFTTIVLALYNINGVKEYSCAGNGVITKGMSRVNPSTHRREPCGLDSESAKANGCVFDLLTMAWLHPECYDEDLSKKFPEVASEPFYYDKEGIKPLKDYKELSEVKVMVWTTRKYHIYHCTYGWRLMHVSIRSWNLFLGKKH